MKSKITVIICTRNRFDDFRSTIASIMLQNRLPDELVIVDSSDAQELDGYLKSADLPVAVKYICLLYTSWTKGNCSKPDRHKTNSFAVGWS